MIKLLFLLGFIVSCGKPITESGARENKFSNELRTNVLEKELLGMKMFMNFDLLPLEGEAKEKDKFWSGDTWRLKFGSINFRWNSPLKEGRGILSPFPRELRTFKEEDYKRLSPAEKYDLLQGRYDYPLKYEVEKFLPYAPEDWEGLCHGWAGASLNHKEPKPRSFINPDGLVIPFGSADIKALLTYYYAQVLIREDQQLGQRCEMLGIMEEDLCDEDVSAADFHTVITNKLGLRGDSIIIDIDRYREVWNHPIQSFESQIMSSSKAGAGRIIRLRTTLHFIDVAEKSSWEPTNGTFSQITSSQRVEYELTLDKEGNIIDSRWVSKDRPDFIWVVDKVTKFTGYMSDLNRLVEK